MQAVDLRVWRVPQTMAIDDKVTCIYSDIAHSAVTYRTTRPAIYNFINQPDHFCYGSADPGLRGTI